MDPFELIRAWLQLDGTHRGVKPLCRSLCDHESSLPARGAELVEERATSERDEPCELTILLLCEDWMKVL